LLPEHRAEVGCLAILGVGDVATTALTPRGVRASKNSSKTAGPEDAFWPPMKAGELKITPVKAITSEATSHALPWPVRARARARSGAEC
jgi:hypothetical protein